MRVPSAALSYRPKDRDDDEPAGKAVRGSRVYLLDGDKARAVAVRTGITDGTHSEVLEGEIQVGDAMIVRETAPKKDAAAKTFRFRMM